TAGVDAISEVPAERWSLADYYDPEGRAPGKMNTRWGGFIDEVSLFDAGFFGVAPREVVHVSPQQRLLLEVAWESLEDAAIAPARLAGQAVGVYVGVASFDYYERILEQPGLINGYTMTGNAYSVAANRLSYLLDLRGPSVAVDTACSSSLVALHLACQSLMLGESDVALAGGTHTIVSPWVTVAASKGEFMAPDGRCKAFDARANGYVRGEGTGVVVLKRLEDALRDGDRIRAVVRGSAVNQDGLSNGLTAPNPNAQIAVLQQAYRRAGVSPGEVGYVEAHGTGTRLGDPLELNALGGVLASGRAPGERCLVGSVKSNIGHLEAAAGVAGLFKAVLTVEHGQVPASLHFEQPNPLIQFDKLPVEVPRALTGWNPRGSRIAGVSSFGFGGTNAHVVIEQAPEVAARATASPLPERPVHLLCLSARSEVALRQMAARYAESLQRGSGDAAELADTCFTAGIGRNAMAERLAVVARTPADCARALDAFSAGQAAPALIHHKRKGKRKPRIAFLFTGQGAQHVGMARALYESQPVFRDVLRDCDRQLRPLLGCSLLEVLYGGPGQHRSLTDTALAQPALFSLQAALVELLRTCGITPAAVMGHSIGEFGACYAAGMLSLEDGLRLTAERGRLMQELREPGAMLAVFADGDQVAEHVSAEAESLGIAAVNAPGNVVLSGAAAAVARVAEALTRQGLRCQALNVSHAFHSRLMEPAMPAFRELVESIPFGRPTVPFVSTLTARVLGAGEANADYWCRHALEPVRFMEGLRALQREKVDVLLEVGPKPVLCGFAGSTLGEPIECLPTLRESDGEGRLFLEALGRLYTLGAELDWRGLEHGRARRKVGLPSYPFQRERYWLFDEPTFQGPRARASAAAPAHPFLDGAERLPQEDGSVRFRVSLDNQHFPYLGDHRIFGAEVLPATAYIEIIQAAANACFGTGDWMLEDLEFRRPFFVSKEPRSVEVMLRPMSSGAAQFVFQSPSDAAQGERRIYVQGKVRADTASVGPA
ncbi:MAG TPA: type I polyketide synthase, partial [Myxococcaceae bacterium]|nr:type I polyketide synthase [Myxococcaceae bacterium]